MKRILSERGLVTLLPSLIDSRSYAAEQLAQLTPGLKQLEPVAPYEVRILEALRELTVQVDKDRYVSRVCESEIRYWCAEKLMQV